LWADEGWINPGESVIVDPDGKFVCGPASQQEIILHADVDRSKITGPRWQLDVAGHYARPDIFELIVHRTPRRFFSMAPYQAESDSGETRIDTL
jgi:nitrilase